MRKFLRTTRRMVRYETQANHQFGNLKTPTGWLFIETHSLSRSGTSVEVGIMLGGFRLFLILASLLLLTAIVSASHSSNESTQGPPNTSVRPVEDTWHGHKIVDNYRWLEDGTTPQTKDSLKDELAYTRAM